MSRPDTANRLAHGMIVVLLLAATALLRFSDLNWDQTQWIHPDEGHMRAVTGAIRLPDDLQLYFDTANSPLNPTNNDQVYSYGTLPLFATRALAEWLDSGCGPTAGPVNHWVSLELLRRATGTAAAACVPGTFTWTYNAVVGRHLSALADLGTVLLLYLIGRRLYGRETGLLAMGLGTLTAFMIQQAHYFTVDSVATFFTILTAYFALRGALSTRAGPPWLDFALAGIATGLATASKISAAVAAGLVVVAALTWVLRRIHPEPATDPGLDAAIPGRTASIPPTYEESVSDVRARVSVVGPKSLAPETGLGASDLGLAHPGKAPVALGSRLRTLDFRQLRAIALPALLAALLALVAFRVAQAYAFDGPGFFGVHPNAQWFARLRQIGEEQNGMLDYPSGRQWTDRWPVIFPWVNIVFWGMGLPLGLAAWAGWGLMGWELVRRPRRRGLRGHAPPNQDNAVAALRHLVPWAWTTLYFVFYATRWVKAMRYFLPIYPLLLLMAAYVLTRLLNAATQRRRVLGTVLAVIVVGSATFWSSAMLGVFDRPHTRIAASRWIYDNVPGGSVVANEHWDWGLPLRIDGRDGFRGVGVDPAYTGIELTLYDEDTPGKRATLLDWLDQTDYIFLASNRLYGSIPRLPERYPLTDTYYQALFAGDLGFELAGEFTSYLQIGPLVFPDQEMPFMLMPARASTQGNLLRVPLPPAEESFSVYDHPNCLIFRKTDGYSHAKVAALLNAVDLSQAQPGLSPHEATPRIVVLAHVVAFAAGLVLVAAVLLVVVYRRL